MTDNRNVRLHLGMGNKKSTYILTYLLIIMCAKYRSSHRCDKIEATVSNVSNVRNMLVITVLIPNPVGSYNLIVFFVLF